jgi:hypothetical protein
VTASNPFYKLRTLTGIRKHSGVVEETKRMKRKPLPEKITAGESGS